MLLSSCIRAPLLASDRHSPVKSLNYRISLIRCCPQIEAHTNRQNKNMIRGTGLRGCKVADYPHKAWRKFFYLFFLAGRECSRSMSLQFNYHFHSSPTAPFSIFHHQQELHFDPKAKRIKVFGSGNYVIKLN